VSLVDTSSPTVGRIAIIMEPIEWDEIDELWDEVGPGLVDKLLEEDQENLPLRLRSTLTKAKQDGSTTELAAETKDFIMGEIRSSISSTSDETLSAELELIFRRNFSEKVVGPLFEKLYLQTNSPSPVFAVSPTNIADQTQPRVDKSQSASHLSQYLPKYGDHFSVVVENPEMIGNPPKALIVYTVTVSTDKKAWSDVIFPGKSASFQKRYSDFESLYQKVKEWFSQRGTKRWDFKLAPKSAFHRFKPAVIQLRCDNFNDLFQRICANKDLLEQDFFKKWIMQQHTFTPKELSDLSHNTAPLSFIV